MGGGVVFSASPAIIIPKIHYFIAKGSAPGIVVIGKIKS